MLASLNSSFSLVVEGKVSESDIGVQAKAEVARMNCGVQRLLKASKDNLIGGALKEVMGSLSRNLWGGQRTYATGAASLQANTSKYSLPHGTTKEVKDGS